MKWWAEIKVYHSIGGVVSPNPAYMMMLTVEVEDLRKEREPLKTTYGLRIFQA